MFKKFRFFQRFKKLIFGGFAIACGVVTCCLLGSWTYNDDTLPYIEDNNTSYNKGIDAYRGILNYDYISRNTYSTVSGNLDIATYGNSQSSNNIYFSLSFANENPSYINSNCLVCEFYINDINTNDYFNVFFEENGNYYCYYSIENYMLNQSDYPTGTNFIPYQPYYYGNKYIIIIDTFAGLNGHLDDIIFYLDMFYLQDDDYRNQNESFYINFYTSEYPFITQFDVSGDLVNRSDYDILNNLFTQYRSNHSYTNSQYNDLQNQYNNLINNLDDYQSWYYDSGTEEFISKNLWNLTENDLEIASINWDGSTQASNIRIINNMNSKVYLSSGTYTINFDNLDSYAWYLYDNSDDTLSSLNGGNWFTKGTSFTINQNGYMRFIFRYSNNQAIQSVNELQNVMLTEGSIVLPFLPYGIIYSQEDYNTLESQYISYQNNHSYTNTQYNDLQGQYSNLEQDYDILERQYNALLNSSSFDIQQYHLSVAKKVNNQITWDFSDITSIGSSDYIDSFGFLNTSGIYDAYISDYDCILVHLDSPVNILNYDLMFNPNAYGGNINLVIKLIRNGTESVEWYPINDNTQGLSSETISLSNLVKYIDANVTSLNAYTYQDFAIVYTNQGNFLSNIKLNGQGDYNLGFLNGVAQNNRDFIELQSNYDTLENNYNTLESNFESLQERYNDLANTDLGFSMSKLMWNIASTPFESFKSIWSVNFLDFNIASFITGILSIFVIVWLLKKIF